MAFHVEVTSVNYNEDGVKFRHFVDENNMRWYCFKDIVEYLDLSDTRAEYLYKNRIDSRDCMSCLDYNTNLSIAENTRFISSNAVRYIVNRSNKRIQKLLKAMNNLEFACNAHNVYEDANELKSRFNVLKESIENDDYEQSVYQSYEIVNSKSGRDVLDKLGVIDKDVEELIDLIRTDIVYYNDLNEIEMTLVNNEEDFTQVTYTKNNKESTCPSWLRNCVK